MRHVIAFFVILRAGNMHTEPACTASPAGAKDEIGDANLITAESVLQASILIKTVKTYSPGIILDNLTLALAPRGLSLQFVQSGQQQGAQAFPDATYDNMEPPALTDFLLVLGSAKVRGGVQIMINLIAISQATLYLHRCSLRLCESYRFEGKSR